MQKKWGRVLIFGLSLALLTGFLNGCSKKKNDWKKEVWQAQISGEGNIGHFEATLSGNGFGEGSIRYESPSFLTGLELRKDSGGIAVRQNGIETVLTDESSVAGLLLPLQLFLGNGSLQEVRMAGEEKRLIIQYPNQSTPVECTVGKDGFPVFFKTESTSFSVQKIQDEESSPKS